VYIAERVKALFSFVVNVLVSVILVCCCFYEFFFKAGYYIHIFREITWVILGCRGQKQIKNNSWFIKP